MQLDTTPSKRYKNFYTLLKLATREYDGKSLDKLFPELKTIHGLAQLMLFLVRYHWQKVFNDCERQLALYLYRSEIDSSEINLDVNPSSTIEKEMVAAWDALRESKPNVVLTIEDKIISNLLKALKEK